MKIKFILHQSTSSLHYVTPIKIKVILIQSNQGYFTLIHIKFTLCYTNQNSGYFTPIKIKVILHQSTSSLHYVTTCNKMSIFISLQENKSGNLIRQHPNPFDECTNRLTPDDGKGIQSIECQNIRVKS